MSDLPLTFRNKLKTHIDACPDTFTAICKRSGYSTSYVRRILIGDKPNPTLLFVESISLALGADPLELLR